MADQIAIRLAESIVNEGSAVVAQVAFRTRSSATASTPSSVRYRVDCLTTKKAVVEWTSASAASTATITIPGTSNGIINDSNNFEERQLTVEIDTDLSTQAREAKTWRVRNIKTFDGLFEWPPGLPNLEPFFPITNAEQSAGVTPTSYQYPELHVARYGASSTASGTENIDAIQASIDVALAKGGGVVRFEPVRYNLGTYGTTSGVLITVDDLQDTVFEFGGAELFLTATSNDTDLQILQFVDPFNLTFKEPRFVCEASGGATPPLSQLGPKCLRFYVTDSDTTEVGKCTVEEPYFEGVTGTLLVQRSAESVTRRIKGIRLYGGVLERCYYGPNFQQAGDDFEGDWKCHNIRRAYFPYGVHRHRVKVSIENDTAGYTADACINISCQPFSGNTAADTPTQDIHADVTFRGDVQYWNTGGLVVFYHVGPGQTHADHDVRLNLTEVTNLSGARPFLFKSHSSAGGAEETTTTDNVWKNIRIDALASEATLATTAGGLLALNVSPNSTSSIHLGPNLRLLLNKLDGASASDLKLNGWRFYTGLREFVQFKSGDLTSGNITIDLSSLDALPFALKLKTWAKSQRNLSGQDVTYSEDIVVGYNAGGGGVSISKQQNKVAFDTGTASVITIAASGETLTVSFTNYSNSQAWAMVAVEHIWPFVGLAS